MKKRKTMVIITVFNTDRELYSLFFLPKPELLFTHKSLCYCRKKFNIICIIKILTFNICLNCHSLLKLDHEAIACH